MYSQMLEGLIVGISVAAPIGPIGVLCIRRTLMQGYLLGFISGIGAATAHALYGMVSVFGLSIISKALLGNQFWVHLIGGGYLCYLGFHLLNERRLKICNQKTKKSLWRSYYSSLFLTLTNPMTLVSFSVMFASMGTLDKSETFLSNCLIICGVFLSSALWWFALSSLIHLLRHKMSPRMLLSFNRISGAIITLFGTYFILS